MQTGVFCVDNKAWLQIWNPKDAPVVKALLLTVHYATYVRT